MIKLLIKSDDQLMFCGTTSIKSKVVTFNDVPLSEIHDTGLNNTTKVQCVYDRHALQMQYAQRNKDNLLKAKPLKIIKIVNKEDKTKVFEILRSWAAIGKQRSIVCERNLESLDKESKEYQELEQVSGAFWELYCVAGHATVIAMSDTYNITAAVDDANNFQAISIISKTLDNDEALKIEFLVTAPHNLKGNFKNTDAVEGAGTALIEYAIVQALQINGFQAEPFPLAAINKVALKVQSTSHSRGFYDHIFFENSGILKGENLLKFLDHYGGRASSE